MEENNDVLVLDDKKARKLAIGMGLKVIGTVGVVLRAKQAGLIEKVKDVLDSLIASNFRVSDALYNEALRLANEV